MAKRPKPLQRAAPPPRMPRDPEDARHLLAASIAEEHVAYARRDGQSPLVIVALLDPIRLEVKGSAGWIDAALAIADAWLKVQ